MDQQKSNLIPDDQAIYVNSSVSLWLLDSSPASDLLPDYGLYQKPKSLLYDLAMGIDLSGPFLGMISLDFCGRRDMGILVLLKREGFIILDEVKKAWLLHPFIASSPSEDAQIYILEKFKEIRLKPFQKFGFFKYKNRFEAHATSAGLKLPEEEPMGKHFIEAYWPDLAQPDELLCDSETYTKEELAEYDDEDQENEH